MIIIAPFDSSAENEMGLFKKLFGPSKEDIARDVANQIAEGLLGVTALNVNELQELLKTHPTAWEHLGEQMQYVLIVVALGSYPELALLLIDTYFDDPLAPRFRIQHEDPRPKYGSLDDHDASLLHLAVIHGCVEVVEYLVAKGANVEEQTFHGHSPLILAAQHGRLDVAKVLLANGADAGGSDNGGMSVMAYAAMHGRIDLMQLFLEQGAKIESACYNPLHQAAAAGQVQAVEWLLDHGADVRQTDFMKMPLWVAEENNQDDVAALIKKRGG